MTTRILIVDDDETRTENYSDILAAAGYDLGTATSAAEARGALKATEFMLALIDMDLPGEMGVELLMEVNKEFPDVATIMVTCEDGDWLTRMALAINVHGYLIKPVQRSELLITVSNSLKRAALEIENQELVDHIWSAEELIEQLDEALASRSTISCAIGILMEREGITEEAAFRMLRLASQKTNRKLRELAAALVAGTENGGISEAL